MRAPDGQREEGLVRMQDRADAEVWLVKEADLLDNGELEAWLDLFTDDGQYWIPVRADSTDPHTELAIVYDDRQRLDERVFRFRSGNAHAEDPPTRTRRLIGNVQLTVPAENKRMIRSNFTLAALRRGRQHVYFGACEHHLQQTDGRWKVKMKTVRLLESGESLGNLTFLL
jgi:3-phenylpropionate/cinnamic acid dioxygenase small subunit